MKSLKNHSSALIAHLVPFAAWIILMQLSFLPPHWRYSLQTAGCGLLLLGLRPWRYYDRPRPTHIVPAVLTGIVVFIIWVAPESEWVGTQFASLQTLYLRFCIMPIGRLPEVLTESPYAPSACGWGFSLVRLLGSALIIAIIEEFFWRGFLYRAVIDRDFTRIPLDRFAWGAFLFVVLLFGVEHARWLAGIAAGVAYAILLLHTANIGSAIIAHITTNALLGIYVLRTGAYQFW